MPSIVLAILAKFTCALCLTAYAGVLSALGVGFVASERGLVVLTVIFLAVGLLSLGWSARRHHRSIPLVVGTIGTVLVLLGRRDAGTPTLLYAGSAVMMIASLWNLWAARRPAGTLVQINGARGAIHS
ncbi:MAG: MerC family mercury resistance protein [Gemmatimonadales bacterium]|nr:MerC family mercury resistance protein [Gemmatimonadales bacterium]